MTPEPETFEEAVELFEELLRQNSYSPAIVWVEPDDLIFTGSPQTYVRLPVSAANLTSASERFTLGMSEGLGITFRTICELQDATCCCAWKPSNEAEGRSHLMGKGLKLAAGSGLRFKATPVRNWFRWQLLRARYRQYRDLNQHLFY